MKETSKILLVISELLFLCALILPALEIVVLGKADSWEGWRATAVAIWALSDAVKNPILLFPGLAGLGNVVFLVAPWLLLFSSPSNRTLHTFGVAVVLAFVLALWAPHSAMAGSPKLLAGYFAWLLAYVALLGSIVLYGGKITSSSKEGGTYA